jgi:hypothetical protein
MGCGRSGTWVLTHVMGTLAGADVVRQELDVAHFGLIVTRETALVIKRNAAAYKTIRTVPETIEIACIVRHPFDVLTSHLPGTGRLYHISPDRWLGEMDALRHLTDSRGMNAKIIRYEDLATDPVAGQSELAGFFRLGIGLPITELRTVSNNPSEGPSHRDRRLDPHSIHKHRRDAAKLKYLAEIRPALGETLDWVGATFGYDLSIAEAPAT